MVIKLSVLGATLVSGSFAAEVTSTSSGLLSNLAQLIIAGTGLLTAVSAFVIGMRQRRDNDPRDKLIDILLKEREEAIQRGETPAPLPPSPPARKRRRHQEP